MSQQIKNVIIIGAGGNLGPHILAALNNNPNFTVSVLSRKGSSSKFPAHTKVHEIAEDYPEADLLAAFQGQDAIVDLAPLFAVAQHKQSIDAAVKAGVKRYLPGEFGSNSAEPRVRDAVLPFAMKTEVSDYLKTKESAGLTWTGIINGMSFELGLDTGFLGFNIKEKRALIYDSGNALTDFSTFDAIGKTVSGVLEHPAETVNRYIHVNSFHTSQNAILGAFEKATGEKWAVERTKCAEALKVGNEKMRTHDSSGFTSAVCGLEYNGADWRDYPKHFGLWNERFGLPPTNQGMQEMIAKIVKGSE